MRFNLAPRVRAGLYVLTAIGTPVVGYLLAKGTIGELEVNLWGGLVTAVTAMAGLNVSSPTDEK